MKIKFTQILFLTFCSTFAQQTAFFDRSFSKRTNEQESINKREYIINDNLISIKDYKEDILIRSGNFYGFENLTELDEYLWYNINGQLEKRPELKIKNRKGNLKNFNKKGKVSSEILYNEDKIKYIQIWKEEKSYLTNGTGIYEFYDEDDNENYFRVFKDSIEVEGYIIRNSKKDTIYFKTDTKAYPKTGFNLFYEEIANNLNYPSFADILGVNKKITIQFVIDENGNLTDFEPLNRKSLNFEKNAIKKLEKMPKWIPAILNGKNVKTRYRIPITFKH
jgi:hypothetical protein